MPIESVKGQILITFEDEILCESFFLVILVGDSHQVRTEMTVERLKVFSLLLLLAKYSSKET